MAATAVEPMPAKGSQMSPPRARPQADDLAEQLHRLLCRVKRPMHPRYFPNVGRAGKRRPRFSLQAKPEELPTRSKVISHPRPLHPSHAAGHGEVLRQQLADPRTAPACEEGMSRVRFGDAMRLGNEIGPEKTSLQLSIADDATLGLRPALGFVVDAVRRIGDEGGDALEGK